MTERRPSGERKAQLVEAALQILANQGARAVTVKAVATKVGMTDAALFRHFKNTGELYDACVAHFETALGELPAESLPARERLETFFIRRTKTVRKHPEILALTMSDRLQELAGKDAASRLDKIAKKAMAFVSQALAECQRDGLIARDLDVRVLTFMLTGAMRGAVRTRGMKPESAYKAVEKIIFRERTEQVMPNPNDETVIVGGGPAGMLLAYLLVREGVPVHVIERHEDFDREFRGEGIQQSVVRHLRDLGLLDELLSLGIAKPARAARVYYGGELAIALTGDEDGADFGIILHQSPFLAWIHQRLCGDANYRITFGASASDFESREGRVRGLKIREGTETRLIEGRQFVVAAGRGTGLRKRLELPAKSVDAHFNILWLRLPRPADRALVPDGFRAYLSGDSLFILYSSEDGGLQVAWSRRDEHGLKERAFDKKRDLLLNDAPAALKDYLAVAFTEDTKTQFLRVQSDRLEKWFKDGVLFIGDAAHTMSPVGGQGINLAMRDAIVAAGYLSGAHDQGRHLDAQEAANFQRERMPEVRQMQLFQRQLGYFMLGAPRWQIKAFFKLGIPLLGKVGVRQRLLAKMQSGVTPVDVNTVATRRKENQHVSNV